MRPYLPCCLLAYAAIASVTACAQVTPAKRVLMVAADGSGDYKTVQQAVEAAPNGNVRIDIKPGEYREVIAISADRMELHGLGEKPEDVMLVYDNTHASAGGTGKSASVTISGDDFLAENLTIANDFELHHARTEEGSQAVALHATGDRDAFRHVLLLGYQDTLYADSKTCHAAEPAVCRASRQYYSDCYISGHVDFIFGDAKAAFDHCEIHAVAHAVITITAQSRLRPDEDSGYLFRDCAITAEADAQDILLGRPWRDYSTVAFVDTDFRAPLDPKGWAEWSGRLKTSDYSESGSTGKAGDIHLRISPSRQLTAADAAKLTVQNWLAGWDVRAR